MFNSMRSRLVKRSMVAKELLLFFLFCGAGFTSAILEEREQSSQCRKQTVFCPCKDRRGMTGHMLVVTCSDQYDPNNPLCQGETLISEDCVKVNFSSKRHRRDTGNCMNGIIPGSPHTSDKDPQAQMISGSIITGVVDDSRTFKCKVHSNFSANVTWLFNGKPLGKKWNHSPASCKRNLEVKHISKSDAGNYTCVVTNEKGKQASAHAKLNVFARSAPVIESAGREPGDTLYIGATVNITCDIRSTDPLVTGSVLKNGRRLNEDNKQLKYEYHHVKEKDKPTLLLTKLEIKNITKEDAGNYTCRAIGYGMKSFKSYLLKVEPCPAPFYCPPGGSVYIQCPQGTYQPNVSQTSEQACKPCPAGFYCPPKATGPVQCPMGTYQPDINQTSEQACKPCPFFTNSSKNLGHGRPILDEADCPEKIPAVLHPTSTHVTKIVIGTASGVVIILVIVLLSFFIAKKKRLLWFSSLGHRHDPEYYTCQAMLNGDTENAEGAEVFKKSPEIDYEAKHDVFICYCYKDVDWVKELHAELEKRGFECCIDFKTFTIGIPIMQNITEAICYSKKTIAVLSPDFIKSDWCKHELQKALSRVRYHQVVPVMYKNCEIPFALQDTTYLDWENCNVKPYFWEQLEKALRKPNGESYKSRQPQNGKQIS